MRYGRSARGLAVFVLSVLGTFCVLLLLGVDLLDYHGAAFAVYCSVGISILFKRLADREPPHSLPTGHVNGAIDAALDGFRPLALARKAARALSQAAAGAAEILLWPSAVLIGLFIVSQTSPRAAVTHFRRAQLRDNILPTSIYSVLVAAAVYGFSYAYSFGPLGFAFASATLLGVVLKHVSYGLSPDLLLDELRVQSERSQLQFGGLFACDLACLALLLPVVGGALVPAEVTLSDVWAGLVGLYQHDKWASILTGADLSRRTLVTHCAGVAFDVGMLRWLLAGLSQGRADHDYLGIAIDHISRREYAQAERSLALIANPSAASVSVEMVAFLGQLQHEKAWRSSGRLAELVGLEPSDGLKFLNLWTYALQFNLSPLDYLLLLREAVEKRVNDVFVAGALVAGISTYGWTDTKFPARCFVAIWSNHQDAKFFLDAYPVSTYVLVKFLEATGEKPPAYRQFANVRPFSNSLQEFGAIAFIDLVGPELESSIQRDDKELRCIGHDERVAAMVALSRHLLRDEELVGALIATNAALQISKLIPSEPKAQLRDLRSRIIDRLPPRMRVLHAIARALDETA